jgi:hypothetical protein
MSLIFDLRAANVIDELAGLLPDVSDHPLCRTNLIARALPSALENFTSTFAHRARSSSRRIYYSVDVGTSGRPLAAVL